MEERCTLSAKTLSELGRDTGSILDEFDDPFEDNFRWPRSVIHQGMLVQPSPGHKEFYLRLDQSGLVTAQQGETYEVLWNDNSIDHVTSYSLEPLHDREMLYNHIRKTGRNALEEQLKADWSMPYQNSGDTQHPSGPLDPVPRYNLGDLVSVGYNLDAFHDYQGAGIVVEVDDTVIPAEYFIHWPHVSCWMPEEELEVYDE